MRTATRTTAILADLDLTKPARSGKARPRLEVYAEFDMDAPASPTRGSWLVPFMRDPYAPEGPTVTFGTEDGYVEVPVDRVADLELLATKVACSSGRETLPEWAWVMAPAGWTELDVIGSLYTANDEAGWAL